ncbi:MAG: hypothetical protein L0322_15325, partial [Chloroflexi bacterium]|nr:hypothetical protein [Chloroflexota bacterium]
FDQGTFGCLPSPYIGAASVTASSGGSIVATVMEVGTTTLFAYNGFTGGTTNPVIPLVNANNSGFITGIQVQNTGGSSTSVTLSYDAVVGTDCTETKTVPAGQSRTFALYAFSLGGDPNPGTNNCAFGAQFIGAATVSANSGGQDLVGIVNQLNLGTNKGSSYNAFDDALASDTVVMPLIMDRNSGFFTGFNVQNVGGSSTTVTCDFTSNDGGTTGTVTSGTLAPGAAFNHLQLNFLANGFVGSGVCTANTSGVPIIGVVNELGSGAGDLLFTYEAFNN